MMICKNCGTQSEGENRDPRGQTLGLLFILAGAAVLFFSVLLFFLGIGVGCFTVLFGIPLLGLGWWMRSRKPPIRCGTCLTTGSMVPVETPLGRDLVRRYSQQ